MTVSLFPQSYKRQLYKMVKHTQVIRWKIAIVCLTILWGWRLKC